MKGESLHNYIVQSTADEFRKVGGEVHCEHRLGPGQHAQSVDALVWLGPWRFVLEAEQSTARLQNDIAKAQQLNADYLLIIVAHGRMAKAVEAKLKGLTIPSNLVIKCLTLGAARQWIANKMYQNVQVVCQADNKTSKPTNHPLSDLP
jgi:hypothetical protein